MPNYNKTYLSIVFSLFLMSISCSHNNEHKQTEASLSFSIEIVQENLKKSKQGSSKAVNCETLGLETISSILFDNEEHHVSSGGPWPCTDHSGTLNNVTPGGPYNLRVLGNDAEGNIKYFGEKTITVEAGVNTDAGEVTLYPKKIPVTSPATSIKTDSAVLNGSVHPNAMETTYYFEYGASAEYGSQTPVLSAGSGDTELDFNFTLTELTPGSTYHYRIVTVNPVGISYGGNQSFTTGVIWFVDSSVSSSGNGNSWTEAFNCIHGAVNIADPFDEIWLKSGQYQLESTIIIDKAITIYGGFESATLDVKQRNYQDNPSEIIGINTTDSGFRCMYISADATIDGLTIKNGLAFYPHYGGGIFITSSCPTIRNSRILENTGLESHGGGIYIVDSNGTIIQNCIFSQNTIYAADGAAISCDNSVATITNSIFNQNNSPDGNAGGVFGWRSEITVTNSVFFGNSSGMTVNNGSSVNVANSIFWNNGLNDLSASDDSSLVVSFSDIEQTGFEGSSGNISEDPRFDNSATGNFNLTAESPCIDKGNNSAEDVPEFDIDNRPRPVDGDQNLTSITDIGPYEYNGSSDSDNIPDAEEMGPDGTDPTYDGNNDEIPDWSQSNVVSYHLPYSSNAYVTVAAELAEKSIILNINRFYGSPPIQYGVNFDWGVYNLLLKCDECPTDSGSFDPVVTIRLPESATPNVYQNYGPTDSNASDHWYAFLYDSTFETGAFFDLPIVTLYLKDGGQGDNDRAINNQIYTYGGPGE